MRHIMSGRGRFAAVAVLAGVATALWLGFGGVFKGQQAAHAQAFCWPSGTPLGALPPAIPSWCNSLNVGKTTPVIAPNAWLDEFDHGLSDAEFPGGSYVMFEQEGASILRAKHFLHANHWMVDVAGRDQDGGPPWNFGGAMMRPNRSFRFQDAPEVAGGKRLVVEVDVAAGIEEYAGQAWPEIAVTTAARPSKAPSRDDTYSYDYFAKDWTVGCRLQPSRSPICAMYDDTGRSAGSGGRTFEISSFQHEGARAVYGGEPGTGTERDRAWRVCRGTDPDLNCRDRFRWELTQDTLTLYVNGVKYMEHAGLPAGKQLPEALLNGEVYVYFSDWVFKPEIDTVRFHWDRIAINPTTGPAAAPSFGQAPPPAPAAGAASIDPHAGHMAPAAPGAARAAAPAPLAVAPAEALPATAAGAPLDPGTVTFDDQAGENRALNGATADGLINFGSGEWYLSGPWQALTTKSISFTEGTSRATLRFGAPQRLTSVLAYNGGQGESQVTLSCTEAESPQASAAVTIAPGRQATIATGWEAPCAAVTVTSSNGWDTNFDNLVLAPPAG